METVGLPEADGKVEHRMTALPDYLESPDVVKRRRLALDEIAAEDEKLRRALEYWQSKRKDGLLPTRRDIDIVELRPVIGTTHMVDVTSEDPLRYKFRVYGTAVRQVVQQDAAEILLGACPSKVLRDAAIEDYTAVVFSGTPAYHQLVALIDYVSYSYSRLILPLAEDGRRVNLLMVCINARKFSDLTL